MNQDIVINANSFLTRLEALDWTRGGWLVAPPAAGASLFPIMRSWLDEDEPEPLSRSGGHFESRMRRRDFEEMVCTVSKLHDGW